MALEDAGPQPVWVTTAPPSRIEPVEWADVLAIWLGLLFAWIMPPIWPFFLLFAIGVTVVRAVDEPRAVRRYAALLWAGSVLAAAIIGGVWISVYLTNMDNDHVIHVRWHVVGAGVVLGVAMLLGCFDQAPSRRALRRYERDTARTSAK